MIQISLLCIMVGLEAVVEEYPLYASKAGSDGYSK